MLQTISDGSEHNIHMPAVNWQDPERDDGGLLGSMPLFLDIAESDVRMAFLELIECELREGRRAQHVEQLIICIPREQDRYLRELRFLMRRKDLLWDIFLLFSF
jgi:hypothetical protein